MAATVQIHEMSATATGTDKTAGNIRFKAADNATADANDRLQIPAAASIYSYTKYLRAYVSSAPSVDISNLRCYSDGSNDYGVGIGIQYDLAGTFSANINTDIGGTDFFTKTAGSPIDMDAINTGPFTSTGYKGDLIRLQMSVASTASPGLTSNEAITLAYDET